MEPTKEQIQWFWEQCEQYRVCGYCNGTGRVYDLPDCYHQCLACWGRGCFKPDLDLNNLFKYAMPKLKYYHMDNQDKLEHWALASVDDIHYRDSYGETPALALFWAIYKTLMEIKDERQACRDDI